MSSMATTVALANAASTSNTITQENLRNERIADCLRENLDWSYDTCVNYVSSSNYTDLQVVIILLLVIAFLFIVMMFMIRW